MEETGPDALEVAAKAHEEGKKKANEAINQVSEFSIQSLTDGIHSMCQNSENSEHAQEPSYIDMEWSFSLSYPLTTREIHGWKMRL